jgi:hypothetical protein
MREAFGFVIMGIAILGFYGWVANIMEATQEDTRKRDCPDNGFYGFTT